MGRFFKWFGLPGNLVLTCLISLYALIMAIVFRTPEHIICAFAMLLSSLGDIILMNYRPIVDRLPFRGFTAGAASFGLSHATYTAAFIYIIVSRGYSFVNFGAFSGIALFLLSIAALFIMKAHNREKISMLLPLCYLLLICTNCTVIFSCAFSGGAFGIISAIGAISFFISDMFLAFKIVAGVYTKTMEELVWWFYPIGQILILTGV